MCSTPSSHACSWLREPGTLQFSLLVPFFTETCNPASTVAMLALTASLGFLHIARSSSESECFLKSYVYTLIVVILVFYLAAGLTLRGAHTCGKIRRK